nr:hypothetical protein [Tanacetum cinerariifolium]
MATTIEQQVALDKALVPSTQREMLHICPRIPGQAFAELPFEEEILEFIRFLGHGATIRTLTDGLYHTSSIDYAFFIWEDFVYQVEHKNQKKSNEMYYLRFTKVIIHHFIHQNTQQYGAMLPIELINDEIRNTKAYKEYYALATEEAAPKQKASARRKRSGLDTSITLLTTTTTLTKTVAVAVTPKLTAAAKGKQPAKAKSLSDPSELGGSGTDEGTGSKPGVPDVPTDESEEELSWNSSDDEGAGNDSEEGEEDDDDEDKNGDERDDDDQDQEVAKHDEKDDTEESRDVDEEGKSDEKDDNEETRDEESFDPIPQTPESSEDEGDGEEDQGLRINEEERLNEKEEAEELYRDVNINKGMGIQATLDVENSHVTLTSVHPDGQQESSSVSSHFVTSMLNPPSDAGMESIFVTASSPVAPLQTSTPIMTPSTIATITTISHAPIPPTTISSEVLQNLPTFDSVFRFDDRLKSLEANFSEYRQTNSFAEAISNILGPRDAYEADKTILDSYEETVILKRRRDDDDDQEEGPSAGSDRGSKRWREGKELESASASLETTTRSACRSTTGSKSRQVSASESAFTEEPIVDTLTLKLLAGPTYELMKGSCTSLIELEYHLEEVYKATTDQLDWVNPEGQQYPHNLLQPLPLIPNNRGRRVIPFAHFINNDLEYLRGGASSRQYTTSVTKTKAADYENIKRIEDLQFYGFAVNRESALDVYSKRRIITVTDLKIVKWHSYKHLDWILVRRDDEKIYKFKKGDFKRLRLQDIKDMLLLLVQGKLSNLTFEEHFAFNVSLRMFIGSIVIQRRVEDLQLGVESY